MYVKIKHILWKLPFVGLLFFITMFLVLSADVIAQGKERLQPKTTKSVNKKQISTQPKKQAVPSRPLVPEGKQAEITIFATGNVLGYIEPCG